MDLGGSGSGLRQGGGQGKDQGKVVSWKEIVPIPGIQFLKHHLSKELKTIDSAQNNNFVYEEFTVVT
jgi:hypothetical protein